MGIAHPGPRALTAGWAPEKREITCKSTDNIAESRTNEYGMKRGW